MRTRRAGRLARTIILVHCGEPEARQFCQQLQTSLSDLGANWGLAEVDCTAVARGPALTPAEAYVRDFDMDPDLYDYRLARPNRLERTSVRLCVFCISRRSLHRPIFRNCFVHHTEAAGLKPGVAVVPVLFDVTYEDLRASAAADEHLAFTLARADLSLRSSQAEEVADLIRVVVSETRSERGTWARERQVRGIASILIGAVCVLHPVCLAGTVGLSVLAVANLVAGRAAGHPLAAWAALAAAVLFGLRLANPPSAPAFRVLRASTTLRLKKAVRYSNSLLLPITVWGLTSASQGTGWPHLLGFAVGFALGACEQRLRYVAFQLRLRLTGVENHAEHLLERLWPALRRLLPDALPMRPSPWEEGDWGHMWDIYAMRLIPMSRTFLRSKPRVFISYAWQERDDAAVHKIAGALGASRITHFLDRRELKQGLPWRSRIAVEISLASHFVLVLSRDTPTGGTCYREVQQALSCVPLSAWPTIAVCLLDTEEEVLEAGGDPVFAYVLRRAEHVTMDQLTDDRSLRQWLRDTAPTPYFADLVANLPPLVFRRSAPR